MVGVVQDGVEGERVLEYPLTGADGKLIGLSDVARDIPITLMEIVGLDEVKLLPRWGRS